MKRTRLLYTTIFPLIFSMAGATTVNVKAQKGTGVSNLAGDPLSGTLVDLGYYDGTFNLLSSVATTGTPLPGLFGGNVSFDSNLHLAFQPAIRIFSDDGGSAIAYSTSWTFSPGDGSGLDINSDSFDLFDVVFGGALTETGVILASEGSKFDLNGTPNPTFGASSLAIGLVPEPSIYALFIGMFTLGYLIVRRCNLSD